MLGVSWQPKIGAIICLIGGAMLLYKMIDNRTPIDTEHLALLAFCFGGSIIGFRSKQENVHTEMTIDNVGKNVPTIIKK